MEENNLNNQEDLGTPLKVVSFCIPLVGAILYFVHKKEAPLKSKQACKMALIGIGVSLVLQVIATVLGVGLGSMQG